MVTTDIVLPALRSLLDGTEALREVLCGLDVVRHLPEYRRLLTAWPFHGLIRRLGA